jgi:uncharacterized protein YutE (UPF0331/DUF86 family)
LLDKIVQIEKFIKNEIEFFQTITNDMDRELYISNPILRRAVDKSLNDIILAIVDLSMNILRFKKRNIPKTYKDIILVTFEFTGDIVYKIAPLTRCRNETIHGYMNINWENVKAVRNSINEILLFVEKLMNSVGKK